MVCISEPMHEEESSFPPSLFNCLAIQHEQQVEKIQENALFLLYRWMTSKTMKEDADEDIAKYDGEFSYLSASQEYCCIIRIPLTSIPHICSTFMTIGNHFITF